MKVLAKINERIEEIESDERLDYDDADVRVNAPLALHQTSQRRALNELKWARNLIEKDESQVQ